MVHYVASTNVPPFGVLFVVAKEPIHELSATPNTIVEKLSPLFFAMHHTHIPRVLAKQLQHIDQLVVGVGRVRGQYSTFEVFAQKSLPFWDG